MIKRLVVIEQDSPKVKIQVECAEDRAAERVDAHQPDLPELKDTDRT